MIIKIVDYLKINCMSKKLTWLEKLELLIPGFRGYKKRELLREDDRIVRDYVVSQIGDVIMRLEDAESAIVDVSLDKARVIEKLVHKLRFLQDRIRYSEAGYAPHFHRYHINEAELRKIREVDNTMIGEVNKLRNVGEELARKTIETLTVDERLAKQLEGIISKLEDILRERIKIIRGWIII